MQHRKLDALMSSIEKIARVAAAGVEQARAVQTEPSGAKSYENADGTRTIIGNIANGESNPSYTMATHVGDTTPPGTPTGVTASSKSGVVVVEWDGTLTGGIPDDFFCVRIYLDGAELGVLREAGSVSSAKLEGGTTHSVTATAEDDACLPDGTPAHNVSAPTAAVSVTVSEGVESVAAIAQEALDVAEATGQHFWHDDSAPRDSGAHVTELPREEWEQQQTGPNSLWNSLGMLFRDGLNNLLAIVTGQNPGIAIYDGEGNADENILAEFSASNINIGRSFAPDGLTQASVGFFDGDTLLDAQHYVTEGSTYQDLYLSTKLEGEAAGQDVRSSLGTHLETDAKAGYTYDRAEAGLTATASPQGMSAAELSVSAGYDGTTLKRLLSAKADDVFLTSLQSQAKPGTSILISMDEVINSIRTASKTMNLSNVGNGTHTLNLYRQGHFVFASMTNAINPASANTAINAGTVPSGYRPAAYAMCSGNGMVGNTIGGWYYRWRVAPTGAIVLHISVTGAREAPLVMCWYTNDKWPS